MTRAGSFRLIRLAVVAAAVGALAFAQTRPARAVLDPAVRQRVVQAAVEIDMVIDVTQNGETSTRHVPLGSGTVVSADGYILTNYHVVDLSEQLQAAAESQGGTTPWTVQEDRYAIKFTEQSEAPLLRYFAEIVQVSPELDLAVLRVTRSWQGSPIDPKLLDLKYVDLGDSDRVQLGDPIHIFGYPDISGGSITYTTGVVSGFADFDQAAGIEGHAWIRTDATVSGGSSGGTAVDDSGALIGIPTLSTFLDCRPGDTNRDGRVDAQDVGCVPVGGSLAELRPINLAKPLFQQACGCEIPGIASGETTTIGSQSSVVSPERTPLPDAVVRAIGGVPAVVSPTPEPSQPTIRGCGGGCIEPGD